jgi:hypothetical protein
VFNGAWKFEHMARPQASSAATDLPVDHSAWAGAALYSRRNLSFYDLMLAFNDRVFWRCPRSRLVELYDKHVSARHLDIGVANGWLLDACRFPVEVPAITLMDLKSGRARSRIKTACSLPAEDSSRQRTGALRAAGELVRLGRD